MRHDRRIFGRRRRRRGGRPLWLAIVLLGAFLLAGSVRPEWFLEAEFARQRLLAGAAEKTVVIDGRPWRYLEAGSGPPLVLLHGFTGSKENWLPVIDALSVDFTVLAPDLPGWGYGDPPAEPPYGYRADAARLDSFIDAVSPKRPVDLVGHSMGGGITAVFAAERPDRIRRLVLMDAAGVAFDNEFASAVLAGEHPFRAVNRDELRRYLQLVFVDPPWLPWPIDRALLQRRIRNERFEREVLRAMSAGPDAAAPERAAPQIEVPTLLLWCRDDQVVDVAAADRYAALIPRVERVLLDGCNHMPMMERPQATVGALRRFLLPATDRGSG